MNIGLEPLEGFQRIGAANTCEAASLNTYLVAQVNGRTFQYRIDGAITFQSLQGHHLAASSVVGSMMRQPSSGSSGTTKKEIDAAEWLQRLQPADGAAGLGSMPPTASSSSSRPLDGAWKIFSPPAIKVRRAGYMHLWSRETATGPKENA